MVRTVQWTILCFFIGLSWDARFNLNLQQTAWSKMYAEVKSVYFNHPSHGNSTNYYIILGPRDKAVPPTSQQVISLRSEWSIDNIIHFCFFLIHMRALFVLNQSEVRFTELGEYSQNMLNEFVWTPNIASLQFNEYPELGSQSRSLCSPNFFQVWQIPQPGSWGKSSPS